MSRYIDADRLIEEINKRITAAIKWGKKAETDDIKVRAEQAIATFCEASLTVKKISTADVRENVRGEWIEFDSDEDKYDIIKCSCCKHIFTVDSYHWTDIGFVKDDFNFCPNCGADMRQMVESDMRGDKQ